MRNGAYWIWCDIDGHGKRWHLAFTKRSDFGDDDEIVFPLDTLARHRDIAFRRDGWKTRKIAGEWLHSCPKCGVPT